MIPYFGARRQSHSGHELTKIENLHIREEYLKYIDLILTSLLPITSLLESSSEEDDIAQRVRSHPGRAPILTEAVRRAQDVCIKTNLVPTLSTHPYNSKDAIGLLDGY